MIARRFTWVVAVLAAILAAALPIAAPAADAAKTLHVAFPVAETGFDPQAIGDTYSDAVCLGIFDPLYRYDYFARPVVLVPNTAEGLPEITDGGRTYTIRVRRGIFFAADPAFGGKRRELTADDYVYSIKRVFDPKVRSYWLYLFEQTLVGLEAPLERARKTGNFDYDEKIEGLQALDRYTLRIRFKQPDYAFKWWLTTSSFAAVAREVVEKYQDASHRVMENPVGTGPYRLKAWTRGQRITLEANPDFRDEAYPARRPRSGRCGDREGTDRTQAPPCRHGRHRHRRGSAAANAVVRPRRARLRQRSGVARAHSSRWRQAEARAREARLSYCTGRASRRSGFSFSTWTIPSSADTSRRRSRCAGRSASPTTARRQSASSRTVRRSSPTSRFLPDCSDTTHRSRPGANTTRRLHAHCSTALVTRTGTQTATAKRRTESR